MSQRNLRISVIDSSSPIPNQYFNSSKKMKFFLAAVLLIASVAADVSHLNNEYLPPHGSGHHHHHHAEYAEQTNEVPQYAGASSDVYSAQQYAEPSNDLSQDAGSQGAGAGASDSGFFPAASAPQEVQAEPQPEAQPEPAQFNFQDQPEEQQPAAQQFVPQTFGGSSFTYGGVSEQGPAAADQHVEQQYEAAASSSDIDTQYGSNGGYVY